MAFVHGANTRVLLAQYDLSSYLTDSSVTMEQDTAETTTYGATAKAYIAGGRSGSFTSSGLLDTVEDAALYAALGGAKVVTVAPDLTTIGRRVFAGMTVVNSYGPSPSVGGAVGFSLAGIGNASLWIGVSLHALSAETTTGAYASVDNTTNSLNGAFLHLHVTGFSGTSATIRVEHSTDNSNWTPVLGTFTAVTAPTSQQLTATGTVNRYLRANLASGTFSSITFHVNVTRR